jgi:hypothetical protein|tara:strand:+ start:96 stop:317 length:222 start_codon:yes stop_codon:yes gene_type:complete
MTDVREKSAQASSILDNEVFQEMVANIELSLIEQWKHADKQEDRDHYWYKVQALKSILDDLQACMDNNLIENS